MLYTSSEASRRMHLSEAQLERSIPQLLAMRARHWMPERATLVPFFAVMFPLYGGSAMQILSPVFFNPMMVLRTCSLFTTLPAPLALPCALLSSCLHPTYPTLPNLPLLLPL